MDDADLNGPPTETRRMNVSIISLTGAPFQVTIARCLSGTPRTAEADTENIRRKLQVRSRAQIAAR